MTNFSYNFAGAGAVVADSVTVAAGGSITMGAGAVVKLDPSTSTAACPLQWNGDPNTGMRYVLADRQGFVCGGTAVVSIETSALVAQGNVQGTNLVTDAAIYLPEIGAAPSALANYSIVYSLDAATKTQLNAKQGAAGTVTALAVEA